MYAIIDRSDIYYIGGIFLPYKEPEVIAYSRE